MGIYWLSLPLAGVEFDGEGLEKHSVFPKPDSSCSNWRFQLAVLLNLGLQVVLYYIFFVANTFFFSSFTLHGIF